MDLYQVWQLDFDHSYDKNDVFPTSILFKSYVKAEEYVKEHGGIVQCVKIQDA